MVMRKFLKEKTGNVKMLLRLGSNLQTSGDRDVMFAMAQDSLRYFAVLVINAFIHSSR